MSAVKVYEQGESLYVIGTEDVQEARRVAGISSDTHRWAGTGYGMFVRRQGRWRLRADYLLPKDARPGVAFFGPIRPTDTKETS